tara:strand:- start:5522 stop:5821 length:300 start_codon:yes stop_codon:yes gene_type:complete
MSTSNDAIKKDIDDLRAVLNQLTSDVSELSKSTATNLKSQGEKKAAELKAGVQAGSQAAVEKGRESAAAIEGTVRERPFQSLMVAFGAGLILSQILRKR